MLFREKKMLKRFIAYYKPHRKLFFMDMLASLLVAFIGIVYPIVTRTMLNNFIPGQKYKLIIIFGVILLVLYVVKMLLNYFIQYYGHIMGVRMQAQMRSDLFNHLEKLPYSFYDNHETGKIMSRMTNDLFDVSELAHHGPENLIVSTVTILLSFTYLMTINVWLTLIVFTCVPLLLLIAAKLRRKMRDAFRRSRESIAVINSSLEGSISGIRVTKAFDNAAKESEKFEEGNREFVAARKDAYNAMGQFHAGNTFITDIFNVVILIAGGLFLYSTNMNFEFADYSAFAVSIGKGLTAKKVSWREVLSVALWFGGFQALMPVIGYYLGVSFADLVAKVDHWIAFGLLALIGGNMIREALKGEGESVDSSFAFKTMLLLAIATSIDALAVGVSFAFLQTPLWSSVALIGVTTALFSAVGLLIGKKVGMRFHKGAEILGGVILIAIGIKILIEHLFL